MNIKLFQGVGGVKQADLPAEMLVGVTLAALMIPLNIGYAQVAGLPATVSLYAAIFPMIAYAMFCTSRPVVASPDVAIAALLGSALVGLATPGDPRYIQLAYAVTILCALIFFLFWFFQLGFLANVLSRAVLAGFVLQRASKPATAVLAGVSGKDRFVTASRYPEASPTPGLLIYRFSSSLIFANAE